MEASTREPPCGAGSCRFVNSEVKTDGSLEVRVEPARRRFWPRCQQLECSTSLRHNAVGVPFRRLGIPREFRACANRGYHSSLHMHQPQQSASFARRGPGSLPDGCEVIGEPSRDSVIDSGRPSRVVAVRRWRGWSSQGWLQGCGAPRYGNSEIRRAKLSRENVAVARARMCLMVVVFVVVNSAGWVLLFQKPAFKWGPLCSAPFARPDAGGPSSDRRQRQWLKSSSSKLGDPSRPTLCCVHCWWWLVVLPGDSRQGNRSRFPCEQIKGKEKKIKIE